MGSLTPVVRGKLIGSPRSVRTARKAKHSASTASPRQPTASARTGSTFARSTDGGHQRRIASAPTAKNEPLRPRRQNVEGLPDRPGGKGRQGRGAVFGTQALGHGGGEIVAVQRFRRWRRKIRMGEQARQPLFMHLALRPQHSVPVHVAEAVLANPVVQRRIRGTGVEGHHGVTVPPCDVADAAKIENRGLAVAPSRRSRATW